MGRAGVGEVRRSVELSKRIGLAQIEVRALESVGFALLFDGRYDEAQPWIEKAIAAARHAGARRYLAVDCMLLAGCRRAQGRLAEARELVAEAMSWPTRSASDFWAQACSRPWRESRKDRPSAGAAGRATDLVEDCLARRA